MPGSSDYRPIPWASIASVAVAGVPPVLYIFWQAISWFIHDWHWLIVLVVLVIIGALSGESEEAGMILSGIASLVVAVWLGWLGLQWLLAEWHWAWLLAAFALVPLVTLTVLTMWERSLSLREKVLGDETSLEPALTALATAGYLLFASACLLDGLNFAIAVVFPAWLLWTITAGVLFTGATKKKKADDAQPSGDAV